jgi:phosphopentomutase
MARAIILVLDSVGVGAAPDAAQYGDEGADTLGHIADACARGEADRAGVRTGALRLPHMVRLGLGRAAALATGRIPPGLEAEPSGEGSFGCAAEKSKGKDTPSGHWEIAGLPVPFEWGYFPRTSPCFPAELIRTLCDQADLPGILGDCHASGTTIIEEFGEEHLRTGKLICYTSADSVFQIAAHETAFGVDRLYSVCEIARRLVDPLNIGRVIARPFVGNSRSTFARTGNRRDFAVPPPEPTILDSATAAGRDVITVGKIGDIFAHSGTGRVMKANGNDALFNRTVAGVSELKKDGLLFANFVDFDSIYGHRRDVAGYAAALEEFDARLPDLLRLLRADDLLVITADHGCDPTWSGTDHTREQVPVLAQGPGLAGRSLGKLQTYADIGTSIAQHLSLPPPPAGRPFL